MNHPLPKKKKKIVRPGNEASKRDEKEYMLCRMSETPSGKREGFQDNATRKKGSLLLIRVRAPAASYAVVRGSESPEPELLHKFIGWA